MRTYELLCMLKAGFDIENTDQTVSNIEKQIETLGGKVTNVNKMGRKRLAFEIAGNRDGFSVALNIEVPPEKLVELKRYLKLNDNILRDFITTLKPVKKVAEVSQ